VLIFLCYYFFKVAELEDVVVEFLLDTVSTRIVPLEKTLSITPNSLPFFSGQKVGLRGREVGKTVALYKVDGSIFFFKFELFGPVGNRSNGIKRSFEFLIPSGE